MTKLVVAKLAGSRAGTAGATVVEKRVRDAASGKMLTVRTIDAQSDTLGRDLNFVFARNVAKARRENKAVTGVADRAPARD
jgi:hypothetical protein